jgi:glutamate--cysteine ligase
VGDRPDGGVRPRGRRARRVIDATRLVAELRDRAFAPDPPGAGRRIGAEVELIAVDAATRRTAPIATSVRIARAVARDLGLREFAGAYGVPNFNAEGRGALTFEPGGQIEYSAPPYPSASALAARLRAVVDMLRRRADAEGVALVSLGIDPCNPVECVPLQLGGVRYPAMDAYFATIGRAGSRMMRQTASFQVSLDVGDEPEASWRLLNAAAPLVVAAFANSSIYEGRDSGHKSYRAHVWRTLDPARTGVQPGSADPGAEYGAFALAAPVMLHPDGDGRYRSFGDLLARGEVSADDWAVHLTTLFPEVRPRGTFEVRSADAVPVEWSVVPLALLGGIAYDASARAAALELLGPPDPCRLVVAGQVGLADARVACMASDLFDIAMDGCRRLGDAFLTPADGEVVDEFRRRYVAQGRSPGDDTG